MDLTLCIKGEQYSADTRDPRGLSRLQDALRPLCSEPRGLTKELPSFMEVATVYEPRDGYLLTARGNPFGNVIKDGARVILHSASGLDFEVPVLKEIDKTGTWRDESALVAKKAVGGCATDRTARQRAACRAARRRRRAPCQRRDELHPWRS